MLATVLLMSCLNGFSQQRIDYTNYVEGAACDDAQYWTINLDDLSGAVLQCDTWSSRGGKDGSNMTTPFMEYWIKTDNGGEYALLPDAEVRHVPITGLPKGKYVVSMLVRTYVENILAYGQSWGVFMYANGVLSHDIASGGESSAPGFTDGYHTRYGNGFHHTETVELECEVGDDGTLDFGINTQCYTSDVNWVAWKDVRLYFLSDGTLPSGDSALPSGDYYLRNKATGQWLDGGGRWGTEGVLASHPCLVHAQKQGTGIYQLTTEFCNPNNGLRGLGIADGVLYVECSPEQWTIAAAAQEGFFTIACSRGFLGSDQDGTLVFTLQDAEADEAQWQLLTRRQMLEELLSGKATDATFMISNPRFDRNHDRGNWEGSNFAIGGEDGQYGVGNYCAEVWNSNYDVYQTLQNVPNGRYRLQAQGFYRYNNVWGNNTNYNAYTARNNGTEQLYARIYADGGNGEAETSLQSIVSERDNIASLGIWVNQSSNEGYGMPFSMSEAANTFTAGLYRDNQLEVDVVNHELTFGIRKQQQDGCDWTIWDNFELTLLEAGDNTNYVFPGDETTIDIPFEEATPDNPVDCTSLIQNPNFKSTTGWQGSPKTGGTSAQKVASMGHWEGRNTFDVGQQIFDLPNGLYKLTAQGFYRYGDVEWEEHDDYGWHSDNGNNVWAMYTIPYATISHREGFERQLAMLYGNNAEVGLPSIFYGAHDDYTHRDDFQTEFGWVPGSVYGASEAFQNDEYKVELFVPVTDGTLSLGVKKEMGYKYDWACWSNLHLYYLGPDDLEYVTDIDLPESVDMTQWEKRQLQATVTPATASDKTMDWWTSDYDIVEVDQHGNLRAKNPGSATVYVSAAGSEYYSVQKEIPVTVSTSGSAARLIINELQVSNLDMFLDPSVNYGAWLELYNPTSQGVSLRDLYISDDASNPLKFRLNSQAGAVPPMGFALVWFDHNDECSSNVNFKPDMDGGTIFISDAGGNTITSYTYPKGTPRTAFARNTDGGDVWGITDDPTPGRSNNQSEAIYDIKTVFDRPSPLAVMAAGYDNDAMFAHTAGTGLPVLKVTTDPKHLYNDTTGIFVTGINGISGSGIDFPCNWNREWDRPAYMEYFVDGERVFAQECNLSRFGGWSRSWYPYNFKLKAQKQYGNNYFEYPFFYDDKPYLKHKVLQVRNGGNDINCRIKDAALHNIIITSGFYLDCQDYQPACVYINGKYIGMLNLREPSNKHFALANYGIDTDEMDQMEVTGGVAVKAGTADAFWQWYNLSSSASDETVYSQISDMVDVEEFANYMAAELYLGGDDWPGNNCKAFKGWDGKFHVVFFDVDQALRYDSGSLNRITNAGEPLMRIFRNMLGNATFRKLFIDSYCLFGGSVMQPERCHAIIDSISAQMNPALALEGLSTEPTASFMKSVLNSQRHDKMINALKNWQYTVNSCYTPQQVSLATNVATGRLQVNGIDVPTGRFSGTLFAPVVLTASAPEGYVFRGWQDAGGTIVSTAETYDISNLGDFYLTAIYEPLADDQLLAALAMPVKVNELSAGNTIFVNDQWKRSDWVELFNNTDATLDLNGLWLSDDQNQPLKYQIQQHVMLPPGGHHIVWADGLGSVMGSEQQHASFKLSNTDNQMVIVSSSDAFVSNNADFFDRYPQMKAFVDGMTYRQHRGDQSVGRYPDGGSTFYQMGRPTIERANTLLTTDERVGEDVSLMGLLPDGFTLELATGWNWISHPLYSPVAITDFPEQTQRIISQTAEAYRDTKMGMVGTLRQMDAGRLYKAKVNESALFVSIGSFSPANMPIPLKPGWNWVGYPVNGMQTLHEALANYLPEEGDCIMGQDGFATYDGSQWVGSLTTLQTGKGYMFYTSQAKTLCFHSPQVAVNLSRVCRSTPQLLNSSSPHLLNSKYDYPNVMGVIAELLLDGDPVGDERFSLLAYSDNQLRGAATWVGSHAFVTLYGNGGEPISYRAVDNVDGMVYAVSETDSFTPSIEGSLMQPRLLTIGEPTGQDVTSLSSSVLQLSSSPVGYYSLSGVLIANRAASLPSGTYIVRYADGSHRKVQIP